MSAIDAKLRASLREALPCRCGGIPRGGAGHFSTCPAGYRDDILAAIAPIIAEARRDTARRFSVWPTSNGWYASWQKQEGSGFYPEDAESVAWIASAIGVTVEEVRAAIAAARTPEAGDGE